jgi:hypothetical protein
VCGVISVGLSIKLAGSKQLLGGDEFYCKMLVGITKKERDHLGDLVVDRRMKSLRPVSSSVPGSQANVIHFSAASVYTAVSCLAKH